MGVGRHDDNAAGEADRELYNLPTTLPEAHNISRALGNISGLRCLDLMCGTGRWARYMMCLGACDTYGFDTDAEKIAQARKYSRFVDTHNTHTDGCNYIKIDSLDAIRWVDIGEFDVIVASHLHHAVDGEQLKEYMSQIISVLAQDGRILAIVPDFNHYIKGHRSPPKRYGQVEAVQPLARAVWEHYATELGLVDVRWLRPEVPDDLKQGSFSATFWMEWERHPSFVIFEASNYASGMEGTDKIVELGKMATMALDDQKQESEESEEM